MSEAKELSKRLCSLKYQAAQLLSCVDTGAPGGKPPMLLWWNSLILGITHNRQQLSLLLVQY